ncbi:MAG TPA: hypothetical protein VND68_01410 [Chloroflexia bacterium]|jgi:hypothetical protein|nr:hypothetical protein [Chloroflexia bacterium]
MLENFTVATFSPHVGDKFRVFYNPSSALELTLTSAEEFGTQSAKEWSQASGRAPFTLTLLGPVQEFLPQGLYRVEHDELEPFEVFIVPLGPGEGGLLYEIIFT